MTIHHMKIKKATKIGVILEEHGDNVIAKWPQRAVVLECASPDDALMQMQAVQALDNMEYRVSSVGIRLVHVFRSDGYRMAGGPYVPADAHGILLKADKVEWEDPISEQDGTGVGPGEDNGTDEDGHAADDIADMPVDSGNNTDSKTSVERINGVAVDGRVAYKEGTPSGDCPYSSEDEEVYDDFVRWNEEWDEAADAATEEESSKGGSVVSEKYRAKYAELGHPTHCGDWLADLLNNLCLTAKGTDLERFEAICAANGVDTSKYRRDGIGWQGRIRMTGRNLLAKKVYLAGGVLLTPIEGAEPEYRAPGDWMANQRFKMPKAEQAKPVPAPATETEGE